MRKTKYIALAMTLASCLSLLSTGFAIWYQVEPLNQSVFGSFSAYSVEDMTALIENKGTSIFHYSSLSFVDASGNAQDSGQITVQYAVDLAKCKAALEATGKTWDGTLTVVLGLLYKNLSDYSTPESPYALFADIANDGTNCKSVSASISGYSGSSFTNNGTDLALQHTFTGLGSTGTLTFTAVYTFYIPYDDSGTGEGSIGNFRNNFGKYLKEKANDKTEFITSAKIYGLE